VPREERRLVCIDASGGWGEGVRPEAGAPMP
jgi:hypothetical protein